MRSLKTKIDIQIKFYLHLGSILLCLCLSLGSIPWFCVIVCKPCQLYDGEGEKSM